MKRCKGYVGLTCVDGSCPSIHSETDFSCKECGIYYGCKDCYFKDTKYCDNYNEFLNIRFMRVE